MHRTQRYTVTADIAFGTKASAKSTLFAAAMQRAGAVWLLFTCLLLAHPAHAVLDRLPFIGSKFPFKLQLADHQKLADQLNKTLEEQRKQSAEFEALDTPMSVARFDRDIIGLWLESEGFFDYRVSSDVTQKKILHTIEPGVRYTVDSIQLKFPTHVTAFAKNQLPISEGAALRAQAVLDAQDIIRNHVATNECLYQINVTYDARVDHSIHKAYLTFTVKDSPSMLFGDVTIDGTQQVEADFLRNYIKLKPGTCFKGKELELSRLQLLQSNLLSRVEIETTKNANTVDVAFTVTERNHRTLKAGVGYDSDNGAGITLGWQHRNLFHHGERFDVETKFNELRREVGGSLVVPHFKRREQTLTLNSEFAREKPEGYVYTYGEFGATLNRPLSKKWAANAGVSLEFSRDERDGEKEDYALLSTPISVDYNRSNQILNPQNGWILSVQARPFIDLYNETTRFVKTSIAVSTYFSARSLPWQPVLAVRAATGSIHGEPLDNIPSKHRYYVGGGGSVRGYSYQSVGELADTDDRLNVPEGGLSFAETSVELRLRIAGNWGAAVFVDGGYAYRDEAPDFGDGFLWGAGVGLRYYTSFAPIRFDVATPLDARRRKDGERKRIDDRVQLYISIGQAF